MRWKGLLLSAFVALFGVGSISSQSISASDAKSHIGQSATVCGQIASERTARSGRGEPTFINLDAPYPNEVFTILIWGEDLSRVGALPQQGSRVCATGLIREYRGVPEIVVKSSSQLGRTAPSSATAAPAGATAQCRDGSYSYSQHHQGTCSHHGGVAQWLQ